MGIAAAVVLALVLGGLVVAGRDSQTVLTDTPATSTPPSPVPYLTFGDTPGEVFRTDSHTRGPSFHRYMLRDPASRDIVFEVAHTPDSFFIEGADAGVIAGRPTVMDPLEYSPAWVASYMFGEGDDTWSVTGRDTAVGVGNLEKPNVDEAVLHSETVAFVSELRVDDGPPVVGPRYREIPVWTDREQPVWSINTTSPEEPLLSSQTTTLSAFRDTSTEIDDLPGTRATVRGHLAAVSYLGVIWRETPESVFIVTSGKSLAEQVRVAQGLLDSDRGTYERLPGIEANPAYTRGGPSIVVTAPPDSGDVVVRYLYTHADGSPILNPDEMLSASGYVVQSVGIFGSQGKFVIPKEEIYAQLSVPPEVGEEPAIPETEGLTGVYLWAEPADTEGEYDDIPPPACATKVEFPPVDSPPTQVELDPDCMTG